MTITPADPIQNLNAWLASLVAGEPTTIDGLGVIPLYAETTSSSGFAYLPLPEAHARGVILVTEKPDASVPTLLVANNADQPVLVLDGEEIVGGLQNRVVTASLLIPARSMFELDVTCVEHGRWHATSDHFSPGESVYPSLRRQKLEHVTSSLAATGVARADQVAVWREISATHERRGTRSPSQAIHDVYLQRADVLCRAEEALPFPSGDPVGVVALIGGKPACADIFDRSTTLRAYWPRLVRSYALEAEDASRRSAAVESAQAWLAGASAAPKRGFASRGLGTDVRIQAARLLGAGLVHADTIVHTALFARPRHARPSSFSRPADRARRLRNAQP